MFVLCVLYSKDKRQSQENQDREVWTKHKARTKNKKNPVGGDIFPTCADWLCGPSSFLYNGYQVSFLGVKQPRHCFNHPLPSSSEVAFTGR
jgi:hypothetical protein